MPYTFFFIMGAFFLVPVCLVGTLILCFFVFIFPSLIKKTTQKSTEKLRIGKKILLSVLFSILAAIVIPVCFLLLGGAILYIDSMNASDYWRYNGAVDFFRMPLEPPYELVMCDVIDHASIGVWQEDSSSLVWGITRYEKRGTLMFGETFEEFIPRQRTEKDKRWFIFDLSNGDKVILVSEEEFAAELKNRGIEDIHLKTVMQNWDEYWANPRREKE